MGVLMRQLLLTAPFIGRQIYRGHRANFTPPLTSVAAVAQGQITSRTLLCHIFR